MEFGITLVPEALVAGKQVLAITIKPLKYEMLTRL